MTISWLSISISFQNEVLFNGYFSVDNTSNRIQNFYYVNNNQYVDILLRDLGDYGSDNTFINNNFTEGGTNILSVIPYINTTFNNPYKLNLYLNGENNSIAYNRTNVINNNWEPTQTIFTFTFTSISGLPSLSIPRHMGSLFTNNAQVYYKPHSLSTGSGGSGVRNYRKKQRRT
jgi:hypothetical protein